MLFADQGRLTSSFPAMTVTVLTVIVALCWALARLLLRRAPYPPGPPISSLISGNRSQVPSIKPWLTYVEWGKLYGNLIHYRTYSQHVIVLNSLEDALELLEKRSYISSGRPYVPMFKLMGWDFNVTLMAYSDSWRSHRRLLQHGLRPDAVTAYRFVQKRKIGDLLFGLLRAPDQFMNLYRFLSTSIIMSAIYGYEFSASNDKFVRLAGELEEQVRKLGSPEEALVNWVPLLRFVPVWFPGAKFKQSAHKVKFILDKLQELPFRFAMENMAAGTSAPCVVADLLENYPSHAEHEVIKRVAASSYSAGIDPTSSALGTFFLAMASFPEIQKRAQEMLDAVIGPDRLPDFDDRPSLPYLEAITREIFRWRPVLPLSVPHSATEDIMFKGFLIPKGATIFANIWAMTRDETKYDQPDFFNPNRFFDDNGELNDDELPSFGFGRRICPGRYMASGTIWLCIASVLSMFNITKKKDQDGNIIHLQGEYMTTGGLASHPIPFECSITPRSPEARRLIEEAMSIRS
ncbi:cytochrome P450 [Gymnopilus junonius]|uniref:Cytochrome P450 n=1 Tax=Gymnopilus junonius TaxID=109634 RepID=A0A9P5NKT0_GYMJU|nr:cytochrome P450 [Gymnopilus junonius]